MIIRTANKEDIPQIIYLIRELAIYEKAVDEVHITENQLLTDGFGENPLFEVFIAEIDKEIAGMAFCFKAYSTWKGRVYFLEDLIVRESYRGNGIGSALFEKVKERAREFSAARLQWQVLEWNEPAIGFYNKMNAQLDSEWINCKLQQDQL